MQDLNDKITGNTLRASEWNEVPSELQNTIESTGQTLSEADLNQVAKAVAGYAGGADAYTDSGSVNFLDLLPIGLKKAPPAYADQLRIRTVAGNTNTGAVTVNVAGIGVKTLVDQTGLALVAGDIIATSRYEFYFDSANDRFVYEKPGVVTSTLPPNFQGISISNNGTTPATIIDVNTGSANDSTNTIDLNLSAALGKDISSAWAEGGTPGAPLGGFPSGLTAGSPVNGTWYRIFAIRRATGQIDAGYDIDASATNLLADATDYSEIRRVGWIYYDAGAIKEFREYGGRFYWDEVVKDAATLVTVTGARAAITITTPPNVIALLDAKLSRSGGGNCFALITSGDQPDTTPATGNYSLYASTATGDNVVTETIGNLDIHSGASQIFQRGSNTGGRIDLFSRGWIDQF